MFEFYSGPVLRQFIVVFTVGLNILTLGMGVVWTSPVLVKLRDENQTVLPRPITEEEGSWIVSITPLNIMIGLLLSAYLIDDIGRKYCIILGCLPRIIMCLLFIFASEVWMLYLGRALGGLADGLTVAAVAAYNSEIASKEIRGALGTISQVLSTVGMLIILSVGPFVSYLSLNIMMICIAIAFTIPLFFVPETPYFLYKKGRTEDSLKVLIFLRGSEELARQELKDYSMGTDTTLDIRDLMKDIIFLKTAGIVLFLSIALQMVGYNAVSFYLQTIFELTQTSLSSDIASVIIGCIQIFACLCTILLTDRFGRKPVLTISLFGMAIGMLGLGSFFVITEDQVEITGFMNYFPLICLMLVLYCHNIGMAPLLWLLVAELLDGPVRAVGISAGYLVTALFMFLTSNFFSSITRAIGVASPYWIFGGSCIITCVFILFVIPETKGKTFVEIQRALGRKY